MTLTIINTILSLINILMLLCSLLIFTVSINFAFAVKAKIDDLKKHINK